MTDHCCKTDACRIKDLESERDALKKESYQKGLTHSGCREAYTQGFADAREMAAKEAESLNDPVIGWHIRRLASKRQENP